MSGITKSDIKPFVQEYCTLGKWFMQHNITLKDHVLTGLKDSGYGDVTLSADIAAALDEGQESLRQQLARLNTVGEKVLLQSIFS